MIQYKLTNEQWIKLSELSTQYCRNHTYHDLKHNFNATFHFDNMFRPTVGFNTEVLKKREEYLRLKKEGKL